MDRGSHQLGWACTQLALPRRGSELNGLIVQGKSVVPARTARNYAFGRDHRVSADRVSCWFPRAGQRMNHLTLSYIFSQVRFNVLTMSFGEDFALRGE
eukprot:794342-Amphidinium_carterae.1